MTSDSYSRESPTTPLALFRGKVVVILEEGPNFTRINYRGAEEHRAFSARTSDLKPYPLKNQ
jgi:hypothetical protein